MNVSQRFPSNRKHIWKKWPRLPTALKRELSARKRDLRSAETESEIILALHVLSVCAASCSSDELNYNNPICTAPAAVLEREERTGGRNHRGNQ